MIVKLIAQLDNLCIVICKHTNAEGFKVFKLHLFCSFSEVTLAPTFARSKTCKSLTDAVWNPDSGSEGNQKEGNLALMSRGI